MSPRQVVLFLLSIPLLLVCSPAQVRVGADILLTSDLRLIEGKRVGLVTNHMALLADGRHLADALALERRTKLTVLFGPEHGIRGDAPAGEKIPDGFDPATGVPVYSLYGKTNKPTGEMLKDVDVLVYDIQDVGARFYTYISTLFLTMEAAAERGIPYIVLDRPNPIGGILVEGPIRDDSLKSFVGWAPMPIAHGMTVGELAQMANGEAWLAGGVRANLTVVKMTGWSRSLHYDETGLQWTRPSPNIRTLNTAVVYPGTCLFEGTNLSEGRGTDRPLEWIGAPFVDGTKLADSLNALNIPGVHFRPVSFTPRSVPGAVKEPKHGGKACGGVFVDVTDRRSFRPVRTAVRMLSCIWRLYPDSVQWRGSFERLVGTGGVRQAIVKGIDDDELIATWIRDEDRFRRQRVPYLLYP